MVDELLGSAAGCERAAGWRIYRDCILQQAALHRAVVNHTPSHIATANIPGSDCLGFLRT